MKAHRGREEAARRGEPARKRMMLAASSQSAITNHGMNRIDAIAMIPAATPIQPSHTGSARVRTTASDAAIIIVPTPTPPVECSTYDASFAAWTSGGETWGREGSVLIVLIPPLTPA